MMDGASSKSQSELNDRNRAIKLFLDKSFNFLCIGDNPSAINATTEVIRLNPNHAIALCNRAIGQTRSGNYESALKNLNLSLASDPNNTCSLINRGWVYSVLDNNKLAFADFNKALEINPNDNQALNDRGLLYSIIGEYALANVDIANARELKSGCYIRNPIDASKYLSYSKKEVRKENGNLIKALIYCNESIRLDKLNNEAYHCRAEIHTHLGHPEGARRDRYYAEFFRRHDEDKIAAQHYYKDIPNEETELVMGCLKIIADIAGSDPYSSETGYCRVFPSSTISEPLLHKLARSGNGKPWLDTFLTHINPDIRDEQGNSALHIAAHLGHIEFFNALKNKMLLAESKSESQSETFPWPFNSNGENPLHSAALAGRISLLIKALENNKREIETQTASGDTILHLLASRERLPLLILLLERFPELPVQKVNEMGQNAFMRAILINPSDEQLIAQHVKLLKLFIEHHIDIYAIDDEGSTALHLAVKTNQLVIVRFLLANGAFVHAQDHRGKLPLDYTAPDSPIAVLLNHANSVKNTEFSIERSKWKNLVFEGGGVKGLAYASALRRLEEEKVICLKDIERVGGTSAGAITALLVGLGFSWDEIEHLCNLKTLPGSDLPQIKFTELLDGEHSATLLAAKNKDWNKEKQEVSELFEKLIKIDGPWSATSAYLNGTIAQAKAFKNKIEQNYSSSIKSLYKHFGLCHGKKLYDLSDLLIRKQYAKALGKDISEIITPVTFKELKAAGFKDLSFVGVNTRTGLVEFFSHELTPYMLVANAVRISMSIPMIFKPVHSVTKNKEGQLKISKDLYIDGGVVLNFPLGLFDYALNQEGHFDRNHATINESTLGLRLTHPKTLPEESAALQELTLSGWITGTLLKLKDKYQESNNILTGNAFRTVYIDVQGINMLDFELVEQKIYKEKLRKMGEDGAAEFIERTSKHPETVFLNLPEKLEAEYKNHMEILSFQVLPDGHTKITSRLNPHCPKLVLSFYQDERAYLYDYLHKQLGVLLYARDEEGMTAFHLAAKEGDAEALERLLKKDPGGAFVKNEVGQTPYQVAKEAGQVEVMRLLENLKPIKAYYVNQYEASASRFFPFSSSSSSPSSSSSSSSSSYSSSLQYY